ncbi:MAG: hypothetical protein H7Y11_03540 [Armatimonadetes bacterium]|nr:hypothetical protein [Anaerolineae bacterium]
MVASQQWATNLVIAPQDIDYLLNLLLEHEMPLSSRDLALALLDQKLTHEAAALQSKYQDAALYNPAHEYAVGQRIIFPALKYATAQVDIVRPGVNEQYGDFRVIAVTFEGEGTQREFASALSNPHQLNTEYDELPPLPGANDFSAAEVLEENYEDIISELEQKLVESRTLAYVARQWFPKDLLLEVNQGHKHLVEAVLDMAGSIPLTTEQLLEQMGGIGDSPLPLQVFSLNFALKDDERFDEVGPAGQVLWYLTRQEPAEVRQTPAPLRYTPIEYDKGLLSQDMLTLEAELADELTTHLKPTAKLTEAPYILTYPHRRAGTIPLNVNTKQIFPTARRAPRIYVTLVDWEDGQEFVGWVVHRENYVFGANDFYRKHKAPIGGFVQVQPGSEPGKIIISLPSHRPRSEYIRLIMPKGDQMSFEDHKRPISSEFDDLMILGVDDLAALDAFIQQTAQARKTVASLLKLLLPALGRLTPQGTVHVRTLYSAINVLRRCPPGPLMATLNGNPDFENVGGHYWRLTEV